MPRHCCFQRGDDAQADPVPVVPEQNAAGSKDRQRGSCSAKDQQAPAYFSLPLFLLGKIGVDSIKLLIKSFHVPDPVFRPDLQPFHEDTLRGLGYHNIEFRRRREFLDLEPPGSHIGRGVSGHCEIHSAAKRKYIRIPAQLHGIASQLQSRIAFLIYLCVLFLTGYILISRAKIQNAERSVRPDHDIVGTQVAVKDVLIMDFLHSQHEGLEFPDHRLGIPDAVFPDHFEKSLSLYQLHDNISRTVLFEVLVNPYDAFVGPYISDDVRLAQKELLLLLKPLSMPFLINDCLVIELAPMHEIKVIVLLDGINLLVDKVFNSVDHAKAAPSDRPEDLVAFIQYCISRECSGIAFLF